MKRNLVAVLTMALAVLLFGAGQAEAQTVRFGYINSQRILAQAPGAQEAQRQFEQDMTRFRTQVDSLGRSLEQAQQQFERQQSTLSADARQQRQQQLQQQFGAYQQRVGELEETAQRRQAELVSPIMQRISQVIEQIRTEGNYAMIFDASAGSLITADPSLDLTEQVLQRLRGS
jgi:outer membrane protein